MNLEQQLRAALAPRRPGPELRAAVMARVSADARRRARWTGRGFVIGSVFAVAAAAALLISRREQAPAPVPTPVASTPAPATPAPPVAPPQVSTAGTATPPAAPPVEPAAETREPGTFTVRVPPLKIEGNDQAGNATAQRFRENVIARLRNVPGLVLLDAEPRGEADVADFDVRIRYSSESNGLYANVESGIPATLDSMARLAAGDMQDRVEYARRRQRSMPPTRRPLAGFSAPPDVGLLSVPSLRDPEGFAAQLVNNLRVAVFPVTPALEQELLGRLGDSGRPAGQRLIALNNLLSVARRRGPLADADAATLHAGADLALTAADTRTREQAWDALRDMQHPELVPHLARGLETEPETNIRLQIVTILASDFRDDPRARRALDTASIADQQTVVRMAALRELQDDSRWNEYVAATLNNAGLTDLQRLQPIADMAEAAANAGGTTLRLDDGTIRELGTVILRAARDPATGDADVNALKVLATIESAAVRDVLLDILRPADDEPRTGLAAVSVMGLRGTAINLAATRFPGDAKIRAAMEEIANGADPLHSALARTYLLTLNGLPNLNEDLPSTAAGQRAIEERARE